MQPCSARYCCHSSNLPLVGASRKLFQSSRRGTQAYQTTSVQWLFPLHWKLFHKIVVNGLESHPVKNKMIDTSSWKSLQTGISGVMEHIPSVNGMIQSAKDRLHSLVITFIDLRNAPILHNLLLAMLSHVKASVNIYVKNLYSSQESFIHTKDWVIKTNKRVRRGVFHPISNFFPLSLQPYHSISKFLHATRGFLFGSGSSQFSGSTSCGSIRISRVVQRQFLSEEGLILMLSG